jgi:hypothetical protein
MKSYFYLVMAALIAVAASTGCKCSKNTVVKEEITTSSENVTPQPQVEPVQSKAAFALPSVIIYKTKGDYSKNVPVGIKEEKTAIVSYPGQTDVKGQEPVALKHGFMLDKRGVNVHSAFLKYTYDEYLGLKTIPPIAELFNAILDADPFTEMYNCGKISDFDKEKLEEQLNQALTESNGNPEAIYKRMK